MAELTTRTVLELTTAEELKVSRGIEILKDVKNEMENFYTGLTPYLYNYRTGEIIELSDVYHAINTLEYFLEKSIDLKV